jgi:hypothetical protein
MKAGEARLLAVRENERNSDFEFAISRIESAAKIGKFKEVLNCKINKKAQEMLKELGYVVREDEYNDLYISWEI